MTVITISREIGSGGGDIAKQVADSLDYHFVDKKMIERVLMEYGFAWKKIGDYLEPALMVTACAVFSTRSLSIK
jgi:cytidylate kinase